MGYTEIGLLIQEKDCRVPVFDTTQIHALAAVEYVLGKGVKEIARDVQEEK